MNLYGSVMDNQSYSRRLRCALTDLYDDPLDRVAAQQVLELIAQQPDVRPGGYDAADRDDQEDQG